MLPLSALPIYLNPILEGVLLGMFWGVGEGSFSGGYLGGPVIVKFLSCQQLFSRRRTEVHKVSLIGHVRALC